MIDKLSNEIRDLLSKENTQKDLISKKSVELEKEIYASSWFSRKIDDLFLPTDELIDKGFYQEALNILLAVKEKEFCSEDLAFLYFDIGVCYYRLGDYKSADTYFNLAISDDEDYRDEVEQIKNS